MHLRTSRTRTFRLAVAAALAALALSGCSQAASEAGHPTASSTGPAAVAEPSATPQVASPAPPSSDQPAAAASPGTAPQLTTHRIAKGYFELSTPENWTLQEVGSEAWQQHKPSTLSLRIQDKSGQDVAFLQTGGDGPTDLPLMPEGEKYTQLDRGTPKVNPENFYSFEALGAQGKTASMNLNVFDQGPSKNSSGLDSVFTYGEQYGFFSREIDAGTPLTGTPDDLTGMERLEVYAKTEQYAQIKAMMLSLRQVKAATSPRAEDKGGGSCIGTVYSYELEGSGLTCLEAKEFVQKLMGERPSAGGVEILGHGWCEIPHPDFPGTCTVESSGASFTYTLN